MRLIAIVAVATTVVTLAQGAAAQDRRTFSTGGITFRKADDVSQVWYESKTGATEGDSYIVGKGGQTYRNFFTIDLRELRGTIVRAELRIRRASGRIGPVETLALFDVETTARHLNRAPGAARRSDLPRSRNGSSDTGRLAYGPSGGRGM